MSRRPPRRWRKPPDRTGFRPNTNENIQKATAPPWWMQRISRGRLFSGVSAPRPQPMGRASLGVDQQGPVQGVRPGRNRDAGDASPGRGAGGLRCASGGRLSVHPAAGNRVSGGPAKLHFDPVFPSSSPAGEIPRADFMYPRRNAGEVRVCRMPAGPVMRRCLLDQPIVVR